MSKLVFLYFAVFVLGSSVAVILTAEEVYVKIKEAIQNKDKAGRYILTPMSKTENVNLKADREIRLSLVTTSASGKKAMPNKGLYTIVKAKIPISTDEDYIDAKLVERESVEPDLVDTTFATPEAPKGEEVLKSRKTDRASYSRNWSQEMQNNVNRVIEVEVDYFADFFWKQHLENPEEFLKGSSQLAMGVAVLSLNNEHEKRGEFVELVIQLESRKPYQVKDKVPV